MYKTKIIADAELDAILKKHENENISWDRDKVLIDGVMYYRESLCQIEAPTNKMTAQSLIKNEPAFDYSFMDEVYTILDENGLDHIRYARAKRPTDLSAGKCEALCRYQIDLHAAYPHILANEELPVDGKLYREEDPGKLNFYLVEKSSHAPEGTICTNDLAGYIRANGGSVKYLFSTDHKTGSNMGERLLTLAYKNEKTKADIKNVHYGYYQKKYLLYIPEEDCYARYPKYNHELLMVAITSQLAYIMLRIAEFSKNEAGRFVVDAYHFGTLELQSIQDGMKQEFPKYDYRIFDKREKGEDNHGRVVYKTYKDIPKAPRSHHKKKEAEMPDDILAATETKRW